MSRLRDRSGVWFESLGHFVCRHRFKAALAVLALTASLASQLPKLRTDTSNEGFFFRSDPVLLKYNAFRDQFGRDELIIVAINPANIFDEKFLLKLKAFHEDLEKEVPYVEKITSLINAHSIRGEGDELIVEDLLVDWPSVPRDMDELRKRSLATPVYRNTLISEEGRVTAVLIRLRHYSNGLGVNTLAGFDDVNNLSVSQAPKQVQYLSDEENSAAVAAVRKVLERHRGPDVEIHLAGSPVCSDTLKYCTIKDMRKFTALALGSIAVCLFLLFRTPAGVLLPLVTVVLALLSTLGCMAIFGVFIKLPTQVLPSFLLSVGVSDSVHILAIFYQRLKHGVTKEEAIAYALGHSGLALVLTSITTAGGLLSFAFADVAPVSDLGIFASLGVMFALVYTLIFLPAMLAFLPMKAVGTGPGNIKGKRWDQLLARIGEIAANHPIKVLAVTGGLLIVAIVGAMQLEYSLHALGWLPESSEVRQATETVDRELKGSVSLEIIVDTGLKSGLYDPATLNKLDSLAREIETVHRNNLFVGKALNVTPVLKMTHQALNENRKEFYTIPQNRKLVAQEFLLLENSGYRGLEDWVDSQFQKARLSLKVPVLDATEYIGFIRDVEQRFQEVFPNAEITVTGTVPLLARAARAIISSMAKSYIIAFVAIMLLMITALGSLKIGMVSMIPNMLPIILCLGIMGWLKLPLDVFSMLVGSIGIGLAVDDTIHFMQNFRRYFQATRVTRTAIRSTLQTTGRAMLFTSMVLCSGFFLFMFSSMNNLVNFGLLTGLVIFMALLADFLVAPALMVMITRSKEKR